MSDREPDGESLTDCFFCISPLHRQLHRPRQRFVCQSQDECRFRLQRPRLRFRGRYVLPNVRLVRDPGSHHRRALECKKVDGANHDFVGNGYDSDRICAHTAGQFYAARFFLGAAESSFFPGMIVYLTHWFCARDRSRAIACLYAATPAAALIGSPLAGWLLGVHWQSLAAGAGSLFWRGFLPSSWGSSPTSI